MRFSITSSAMALAFLITPALAQETLPDTSQADTLEKCRAVPNQNGDTTAPGDDTTLEDCKGVLTPPPTGDGDIAEPPPEGGKTPVITPPAMPEQQPSN